MTVRKPRNPKARPGRSRSTPSRSGAPRSGARRSAAARSAAPRSAAARSAGSPKAARKRQAEPGGAAAPAAAASDAPDAASPPVLSEKQRRHLRGLAHGIKPVIWLGNAGLSAAVTAETARALRDHELIKVKATGEADRKARDAAFAELAAQTASALIHRIGNVAVLYRPNPGLSRIVLPDVPPL
ncbi:MAG: YhbY family RNA-binding protein [Sinobacteraceae bacterium]|nr:YhbY family RNA-binding protein [Nevskiaceae bacterium]